MLRITKKQANGLATLRVEGKLQGPWVETLREEARQAQVAGLVQLDLTYMAFVDRTGVELLRDLVRGGVHIANCSNFVRELLHAEGTKP